MKEGTLFRAHIRLAKNEPTAGIGWRSRNASPASLFRNQGEQVGGPRSNHLAANIDWLPSRGIDRMPIASQRRLR
jgi:hypothetical protein